jgi:pyroglutamyl-peptidase
MRGVLLTSFEPFGGGTVNSSLEAGRAVAERPPEGVELSWALLPVVASRCARTAWERAEQLDAAWLIALGQAAGSATLRLERNAFNLDDFSIPDNAGVRRCRMRIAASGPPSYATPAPLDALAEALRRRGIPVEVSPSAGSYVCNRLYYELLHRAAEEGAGRRVLFVHLPLLPDQDAEPERGRAAARPLEELAEGVRLVVEACAAQVHGNAGAGNG